ncbi:hypothetical protein Catovirus_1_568 [Catovirus CTV1]|uniref:Uncharacterized protein n=1 Tax=Catovirus CTV1 TaxID=1977631 RepID=A0A1V0SA37_9VIRU|nr:hypothetical protein Catovirus_1_568 [Catovirus CTV1]
MSTNSKKVKISFQDDEREYIASEDDIKNIPYLQANLNFNKSSNKDNLEQIHIDFTTFDEFMMIINTVKEGKINIRNIIEPALSLYFDNADYYGVLSKKFSKPLMRFINNQMRGICDDACKNIVDLQKFIHNKEKNIVSIKPVIFDYLVTTTLEYDNILPFYSFLDNIYVGYVPYPIKVLLGEISINDFTDFNGKINKILLTTFAINFQSIIGAKMLFEKIDYKTWSFMHVASYLHQIIQNVGEEYVRQLHGSYYFSMNKENAKIFTKYSKLFCNDKLFYSNEIFEKGFDQNNYVNSIKKKYKFNENFDYKSFIFDKYFEQMLFNKKKYDFKNNDFFYMSKKDMSVFNDREKYIKIINNYIKEHIADSRSLVVGFIKVN